MPEKELDPKKMRGEAIPGVSQPHSPLKKAQGLHRGWTKVKGHLLPEIIYHGTTASNADSYRREDGSYRGYGFDVFDAINGDTRAWPKSLPPNSQVKKATLVINTALAFHGDFGGSSDGVQIIRAPMPGDEFTEVHIRFKSLPKGSYKIISGVKTDFGGHIQSSATYSDELKNAGEILKNRRREIDRAFGT